MRLEVGQCYRDKDRESTYYMRITRVDQTRAGQRTTYDMFSWRTRSNKDFTFERGVTGYEGYFERNNVRIPPSRYRERLARAIDALIDARREVT